MGILIQNKIVYSLSFADDQVLLAQDHDDMEYMAINYLISIWWQKILLKHKIIYLSNYNSEHFGLWYDKSLPDIIYSNGCAKKVSKEIKNGKN